MRAIICAQFNPTKTMGQLINDRSLFRLLILAGLMLAWCV
jgi:hypothetical protein